MNYFTSEEEREVVCTLDYFKDELSEHLKEIKLIEMKREYGSGLMWCKEYQRETPIQKGDCGCQCSEYSPCNYIKGRCRYLDNCFVETGRKFILTKEELKEI